MAARRSYTPVLESLEDRVVPYALTSYHWANPNLSVSIMPDQSAIGTHQSDLFAKYDAKFAETTWERQFARALQTWASVTPLNFHFVSDSGASSGAAGLAQGDSRFGDIRLGAYASPDSYLAYSYFPYASTTKGGDLFLNSRQVYNIGASYDLYSVLVHEVGHTLGLNHSAALGAVMYPSIMKVYAGLSADDIAGIRAIYGARKQDVYDAKAPNNSFASATPLTVGAGLNVQADLTTIADVDYYKVTMPPTLNGPVIVSVDARNLSLLAPRLLVYNASRQLVGAASAGAAYGAQATVTLKGLPPGKTYYIVADGATNDVFGMGAYQFTVQFGGSSAAPTTVVTSYQATMSGPVGAPALAMPMESNLASQAQFGVSNRANSNDNKLSVERTTIQELTWMTSVNASHDVDAFWKALGSPDFQRCWLGFEH